MNIIKLPNGYRLFVDINIEVDPRQFNLWVKKCTGEVKSTKDYFIPAELAYGTLKLSGMWIAKENDETERNTFSELLEGCPSPLITCDGSSQYPITFVMDDSRDCIGVSTNSLVKDRVCKQAFDDFVGYRQDSQVDYERTIPDIVWDWRITKLYVQEYLCKIWVCM